MMRDNQPFIAILDIYRFDCVNPVIELFVNVD